MFIGDFQKKENGCMNTRAIPIDVIEEYIRPQDLLKFSIEVKEALSDTELVEFENRNFRVEFRWVTNLIKTMKHVPNMIEKTLRYPGCVEYLKVLRESGFFHMMRLMQWTKS